MSQTETKKEILLKLITSAIAEMSKGKLFEKHSGAKMYMGNMKGAIKRDCFIEARSCLDELPHEIRNQECMVLVVDGVEKAAAAREAFDEWRR